MRAIYLALLATACVQPSSGLCESTALPAPDQVLHQLAKGSTNEDVGQVAIWDDEGTLRVRVETDQGYQLSAVHLCTSAEPFAWTAPGSCAIGSDGLPEDTRVHVLSMPLDPSACGSVLHLQVHAKLLDASGAATCSAYADSFRGHITYEVQCASAVPAQCTGCTLTKGYWKNHPEAWPVQQLTIGGVVYGIDELLVLLSTPPRGDFSLELAHQLIAALLNQARGATVPEDVAAALVVADRWMATHQDADGRLPYGVAIDDEDPLSDPGDQCTGGEEDPLPDPGEEDPLPPPGEEDPLPDPGEEDPLPQPGEECPLPGSTPTMAEAERALDTLRRYNEGEIGPGHCE
jgi:hypothetical protein